MGYNWISIAIFRLISILQASTLRDRYYTSINRIEVLETAIEDIERINANSADPNALISGICFRIKQDLFKYWMRCLIDHPVDPYFPYIAVAPWPHDPRHYQTDWVDSVATLELWLTSYVGHHYSKWVYTTRTEQEYWQACIAFARAQDCTLFVLRWAN